MNKIKIIIKYLYRAAKPIINVTSLTKFNEIQRNDYKLKYWNKKDILSWNMNLSIK